MIKEILNSSYNNKEYTIDEFTDMVKHIFPVFGEIELDIKKIEGGYVIDYTDKDIVSIDNQLEDIIKKKKIDMSSKIIKLNTDENGVIKIIDSNYALFTPANKREVLFCASIINHRIIL